MSIVWGYGKKLAKAAVSAVTGDTKEQAETKSQQEGLIFSEELALESYSPLQSPTASHQASRHTSRQASISSSPAISGNIGSYSPPSLRLSISEDSARTSLLKPTAVLGSTQSAFIQHPVLHTLQLDSCLTDAGFSVIDYEIEEQDKPVITALRGIHVDSGWKKRLTKIIEQFLNSEEMIPIFDDAGSADPKPKRSCTPPSDDPENALTPQYMLRIYACSNGMLRKQIRLMAREKEISTSPAIEDNHKDILLIRIRAKLHLLESVIMLHDLIRIHETAFSVFYKNFKKSELANEYMSELSNLGSNLFSIQQELKKAMDFFGSEERQQQYKLIAEATGLGGVPLINPVRKLGEFNKTILAFSKEVKDFFVTMIDLLEARFKDQGFKDTFDALICTMYNSESESKEAHEVSSVSASAALERTAGATESTSTGQNSESASDTPSLQLPEAYRSKP
jgi:hypothetical protein